MILDRDPHAVFPEDGNEAAENHERCGGETQLVSRRNRSWRSPTKILACPQPSGDGGDVPRKFVAKLGGVDVPTLGPRPANGAGARKADFEVKPDGIGPTSEGRELVGVESGVDEGRVEELHAVEAVRPGELQSRISRQGGRSCNGPTRCDSSWRMAPLDRQRRSRGRSDTAPDHDRRAERGLQGSRAACRSAGGPRREPNEGSKKTRESRRSRVDEPERSSS